MNGGIWGQPSARSGERARRGARVTASAAAAAGLVLALVAGGFTSAAAADDSVQPDATPTPVATAAPEATPTPEATAQPEASPTPVVTEQPDAPADDTAHRDTAQVVPLAATAINQPPLPICTAGYVYGILNSGQIKQVAPNGTVSSMGSPASGQSNSFNGLGIGTGGNPVYAYNRGGDNGSPQNVRIYGFDTTTGQWSDTGHNVDSNTPDRTVTFVAGAVNLDSGTYFLGGYQGTGNSRIFRLWEYSSATNTSSYRGRINAPGGGTNANGDIAFSSNGDLFIIRGDGSTTTVYSVTAANLEAANGGLIPSSASDAVGGTTSNVNGVAFDASGQGFLSSSQEVQSYNMPGWIDQSNVTARFGNSTDLASCGSPPTITIEKYVEGGRLASTDQFALTLTRGTQQIGTTTTTGNVAGLQNDRIGPIPTVRNVELTFAETAAGTTNLAQYASSYRCLVDGVQTTQGTGTRGKITIPADGDVVECRFYNSPLVATVNVQKRVTDTASANPQPRAGWTVGATATATTGSVTSSPAAATQPTNAAGTASWTVTFGAARDVARVIVLEQMQDGYAFQSGDCTTTRLDGTTATTYLTGPGSAALAGIVPGDRVDCVYTNKLLPTSLTLVKEVAHGDVAPTAWTLTATGPAQSMPGPNGATGSDTATTEVTPNVAYQLAESGGPDTYVQDGAWVCVNQDDRPVTVADGAVTIRTVGDQVTCTITNSTATLTLLKSIDGDATFTEADFELTATPATGLALSQLVAPGALTESAANTAEVRPGHVYTLAESSELTSLAFRNVALQKLTGTDPNNDASWTTVDGAPIQVGLGEHATYRFVNATVPAVALPFTGGMSADSFLIAGGSIVLLALTLGGWHVRRRRRIHAV